MMHLTCIVFLCIAASSSLETTKEERPKAQSHGSDLRLDSFNESGAEGHGDVVRRAIRKYPEDSGDSRVGHRHDSFEVPIQDDCQCPPTMSESTVVALVATLAFLAFLPTVLLLAAVIWFLCWVVRTNKKKEKEEKAGHPSHPRRRAPPVPPPRPDNSFRLSRQTYGYERIQPASPRDTQGVYLNASELHPGPRSPREMTYQNLKSQEASYQNLKPMEPKTTVETGYISPERVLPLSTPPLEKRYMSAEKYMNIDHSHPTSLTGSGPGTTMSPTLSPKGQNNHIYEEIR
ncbi:uncharacterized protein LOC103281776 isoform X2 [Anolis carolinensis]|uniref:uncharacterized protein LOC103281776 isoform X2 n=1 Tax=Anolis carolinensis TaxID=28377 RepID=UPI002F2B79FF